MNVVIKHIKNHLIITSFCLLIHMHKKLNSKQLNNSIHSEKKHTKLNKIFTLTNFFFAKVRRFFFIFTINFSNILTYDPHNKINCEVIHTTRIYGIILSCHVWIESYVSGTACRFVLLAMQIQVKKYGGLKPNK